MPDQDEVHWRPSEAGAAASVLGEFLAGLGHREGRTFADHDALHRWSVTEPARFWSALWDHFEVQASSDPTEVLTGSEMPDVRWFTGARLNYAEHALRHPGGDGPALICVPEDGVPRELSWRELRRQVAAFAVWLRGAGVAAGDRVAAYLPNTEHAVIGLLATASVGAVWACCSPDFGADGTIGRLGQLEPTVLVLADGYHWNGRVVDRRDVGARLRAELTTVRHVVHVPYVFPADAAPGTPWADVVAGDAAPEYAQVEFSHPLWVLFSSGTTGLPKGLVHGHGGIVLEHLKWSGLYAGLRAGDRAFIYTSTGWVLWNMQVSTLMRGATGVLYEGGPGYPDAGRLWQVAADSGARVLGMGAALVTATQNSGIRPAERHDLSGLDTMIVTGSALPVEGYRFVRDHVSARVRVDSTSGGTDVAGAFVGGNVLSPVRPGEISGPIAGVAVAAWDDAGHPVVGEVGELVVTNPMPSMPLYFWNDPDGSRYRESYFQPWAGVWRHGDWVTETTRGTFVIHGRSDATLNRQGVRLGSAEFYEVVEALPEVREALVVGAELPGGAYHLAMFVVPAEGITVDDALRDAIRKAIRAQLTARHLPDAIVEAPGVPHTLTGKRLEVPVKRLLQGVPLERAVNIDTVDLPDLLRWYADYGARLTSSEH
jgi:acetoacetyl-CoA synthetase